ncbi:MAG: winged helix-turn-helix domain-containing protein [Candidatus Korobacteraceae bacterium]
MREHPRCDREQSALVNRYPYGEPQLGRRNLWPAIGDGTFASELSARLWVLNFSDRRHTLLEIAERSGIPFPEIDSAAQVLCQNGLLSEVVDSAKEER